MTGKSRAVNWNRLEDEVDKQVWERLTSNFWLDTRIPLSNDVASWKQMSAIEQDITMKVFTGLTMLDTVQGTVGAPALMEDAVTQHEEAVYGNITFMEALAGGTELLTPGGWKDISEVGPTDKIAQYEPTDNTLSFVNPVALSSHYADEVYEISTGNGNGRQVVSGGHRVHLEEKVRLSNECKDWTYRVLEARELSGINLSSGFRRFRATGQAATGRSMNARDRLLVAIQADGSIDNATINSDGQPRRSGARSGTAPVRFTLTKPRKIERLRALAEEAGWRLAESPSGDGKRIAFRLMVPVEWIGDRQKHFDAWYSLDDFGVEMARAFVEELGHWDAHAQKGGTGVTYYTVDKRNSDFVVAVSALAGYRSRTTVRKDNRADTYRDVYVTNILLTRDTYGAPSMSVERVDGRQVYCVQVPSTFLLTRNGESTIVTGNCVHAKSYSSIFSTLATTRQIDESFAWAESDERLNLKADIVERYYDGSDPLKKKIASTLLESFLFYSGFYWPLYLSSRAKLSNTADIIRLIMRDEAVHGYYIGYKFQVAYNKLDASGQEEYKQFTYDLLEELYENEIVYTHDRYDELGIASDVINFLHYNANKALNNLGFDSLFPSELCEFNSGVRTSLSLDSETHDFFSGAGSSYVVAKIEDLDDSDWDWD